MAIMISVRSQLYGAKLLEQGPVMVYNCFPPNGNDVQKKRLRVESGIKTTTFPHWDSNQRLSWVQDNKEQNYSSSRNTILYITSIINIVVMELVISIISFLYPDAMRHHPVSKLCWIQHWLYVHNKIFHWLTF